jgi:hypothetical protein
MTSDWDIALDLNLDTLDLLCTGRASPSPGPHPLPAPFKPARPREKVGEVAGSRRETFNEKG